MINMKDLIKKQGDMIRKESGMNITEDKIRVQGLGTYDYKDLKKNVEKKIKDLTKRNIKGKFGRGVQHVGYYYSHLKDKGKQKGGKTIWEV